MVSTVTPLARSLESSTRRTPVGVSPLTMKVTRAAFSNLGRLSPEVMAKVAHRLYFSPRRFAWPARERALLERAEQFGVSTPHGELVAYAWGGDPGLFPWEARADGRTVLLMHGWEGRGTQLGAFVEPLLERGLRVVALDAPAHGASPGTRTDLRQFADAILAVGRQVGPLRAVVAHSMGGASTVVALANGLQAHRAVLIGAPSRLSDVVDRFVETVQLTDATQAIFRRLVEAEFGPEVWEHYSCETMLKRVAAQGLIIHDVDDVEVPYSDGVRNAEAWLGARLVTTAGLGHRRVLKEAPVVDEVVRFVAGDA